MPDAGLELRFVLGHAFRHSGESNTIGFSRCSFSTKFLLILPYSPILRCFPALIPPCSASL